GDGAVAIVALVLVADGPGRAESRAAERRSLESQGAGQPPLADGAERQARGREPEDLGRQVLVAAEKPPHAAIVVARLVLLAGEEAANREVLDGIADGVGVGHGGELEVEE